MRLTLDNPPGVNLVTKLGPQGIRIGERWLKRSFIVSAAALHEDWSITDPASLALEALEPALALAPEILVLGTGDRISFPDSRLFAALDAAPTVISSSG